MYGPGGYVYDPEAVAQWCADPRNRSPVFAAANYRMRGVDAPEDVLLYRDVIRIRGKFKIRGQKLGNCVSKAWAGASSLVDCFERHRLELPQLSDIAATPYYGFSRVEVGKRRIRGDGSCGVWAAEAAIKYGCLRQLKYGRYDLTTDDDDVLSAEWGNRGVPDEIEPQARELLIHDTALVTSFSDVVLAVQNRKPVVIACSTGFTNRRDKDGFVARGANWNHSWWIVGVTTNSRRPGALGVNSWNENWVTGPKRDDEPDGCFWIDADNVDRCVRPQPDSYAIAGIGGFDNDPWMMV
jgi:hypothetical protein